MDFNCGANMAGFLQSRSHTYYSALFNFTADLADFWFICMAYQNIATPVLHFELLIACLYFDISMFYKSCCHEEYDCAIMEKLYFDKFNKLC